MWVDRQAATQAPLTAAVPAARPDRRLPDRRMSSACIGTETARLVRARKSDPWTGRLLWAYTGGANFGFVTAHHRSGHSPPVHVRLASRLGSAR